MSNAVFNLSDPILIQLATAIGLTSSQIDDLFIKGVKNMNEPIVKLRPYEYQAIGMDIYPDHTGIPDKEFLQKKDLPMGQINAYFKDTLVFSSLEVADEYLSYVNGLYDNPTKEPITEENLSRMEYEISNFIKEFMEQKKIGLSPLEVGITPETDFKFIEKSIYYDLY